MSQAELTEMLYRPERTGLRQALARLVKRLSGPRTAGMDAADRQYLERASPHLLADVGLRRGGDGTFRPH